MYGHDFIVHYCGSCENFGHEARDCPLLNVHVREMEDVHNHSFSSKILPTSHLPSLEEDYEDVLDLDEAPYKRVVVPHVEIDKFLSVCVHDPSSTKKSLEEILLEFDGASDDKKESKSTKKKSTPKERTYARYVRPLCSWKRPLKDEWVTIWPVHTGKYKLLRDREGGLLHDGTLEELGVLADAGLKLCT